MPDRIQRRQLDGVLLLDKPAGITSNGALQCVKRLYRAVKAGHTGTLDPMATGLLPICFGEATKFSAGLFGADKTYNATVKLGVTTTTGDAEGEIIARREARVGRDQIDAALARYIGVISQTPPMYSALKRDGRPLYSYARKGIEFERAPRAIEIHELVLVAARDGEFDIRVRCSRGTYIRALAEDIGKTLGCGAHLQALRRLAIAELTIDEAVTPAGLEAMAPAQRDDRLRREDSLLSALPSVTLDATGAAALLQGQQVNCDTEDAIGKLRIYDAQQRFLGVAEIAAKNLILPRRLISAGRFL